MSSRTTSNKTLSCVYVRILIRHSASVPTRKITLMSTTCLEQSHLTSLLVTIALTLSPLNNYWAAMLQVTTKLGSHHHKSSQFLAKFVADILHLMLTFWSTRRVSMQAHSWSAKVVNISVILRHTWMTTSNLAIHPSRPIQDPVVHYDRKPQFSLSIKRVFNVTQIHSFNLLIYLCFMLDRGKVR